MAEAENTQSKKSFDFGKILKIGFIAMNLVVVGGGAYFTYVGTLGYKPKVVSERELASIHEELQKELSQVPIMYTMETFNTNLNGLPRKFVRLEVSVEMYSQEGFEELFSNDGKARDALMRILNGKQLEDIETVQGKLHLKNEIAGELNDLLHKGVVKNVYFTKFQVQ